MNDEPASQALGQHHHIILLEDTPSTFSWRKLAKFAGPGLLMCIAYVVRSIMHCRGGKKQDHQAASMAPVLPRVPASLCHAELHLIFHAQQTPSCSAHP